MNGPTSVPITVGWAPDEGPHYCHDCGDEKPDLWWLTVTRWHGRGYAAKRGPLTLLLCRACRWTAALELVYPGERERVYAEMAEHGPSDAQLTNSFDRDVRTD